MRRQDGCLFRSNKVVILSHILHAVIKVHYNPAVDRRVSSFNGRAVRNLAHLASLVEDSSNAFLKFDLDVRFKIEDHCVTLIVLGREESMEASKDILHTHCITVASTIGPVKQSD